MKKTATLTDAKSGGYWVTKDSTRRKITEAELFLASGASIETQDLSEAQVRKAVFNDFLGCSTHSGNLEDLLRDGSEASW